MKSIRFLGSNRTIYFIFALVTIVSGCSKNEEENIKPVDGNIPPPPVTSVTKTVGNEGGIIVLDSFLISIPAGSFINDYQLILTVDQDQDYYQEPAVTSVYKLKGLPDEFRKSIRLSLKYHAPLEGDSYISWRSHQSLSNPDTTIFTYDLIDCEDSSGYLTGWLLPADEENLEGRRKANIQQKNDDLQDIIDIFQGVSSYRTNKTDRSTFFVQYPGTLDPLFMEQIEKNLEDVYDRYALMGFNQHHFPDFEDFDTVKIFNMKKDLDDPIEIGCNFREKGYWIKIISPLTTEEFRRQLGSIFFEGGFLINYLLIKKRLDWETMWPFSTSVYYWLEEKWYETQIPDDFMPSYYAKDDFKIYLDLFSDNTTNCDAIKYLSIKYGEESIIRFYESYLNEENWFASLSNAINATPHEWLPDFFMQLFQGRIYNLSGEIFSEKVFNNPEVTYSINLPLPEQMASYSEKIIDLSARVFRINMNSQYINENSLMKLSLTSKDIQPDRLQGLLFSIDRNSREIAFVEKTKNITISDPLKYKTNNLDLFLVAVNSQAMFTGGLRKTNPFDIQLDVSLKEVLQLTSKNMMVVLDSITIYRRFMNQPVFYENEGFPFKIPIHDNGSFSNNSVFNSKWDFINNAQVRYWGEVKATVDPDSLILMEFDFKTNEKIPESYYLEEYEIRQRITGINVPLVLGSYGSLGGEIKGKNLVQHINIFDYIVEFMDETVNEKKGWFVEDIELTENSVLKISFY